MDARTELKARMIAAFGMDAETGHAVSLTVRMLPIVDIESELAYFRFLQRDR